MDLERSLAHAALEAHPHDAAKVLEGLPGEVAVGVLGRAAPAVTAEVLRFGAPPFARSVLEDLPVARAARVLERIPVEVTAALLRRLSESRRDRLLEEMPEARARPILSLLRYPPGCAGSVMDPRALALPEDVSVEDAMKRLRRDAEHVLFNIYVLDRDDVLLGAVNLRELLGAHARQRLGAIMRTPAQSLAARMSARAVLEHPGWETLCSLPVIDDRGVYVGAVRHRAFRQLESAARRSEQDTRASTVQAIGDLLSTAVGGVLEAMATALSPPRPPSPGADSR